MNRLWEDLHSIIEMSCEMIWSDIKSVSKQVYHIYQLGSDIDVKVDKLSNGMNTRVVSQDRDLKMREEYNISNNEINFKRNGYGYPSHIPKDLQSK